MLFPSIVFSVLLSRSTFLFLFPLSSHFFINFLTRLNRNKIYYFPAAKYGINIVLLLAISRSGHDHRE
jgi:hypothetical protein